MAVCLEQHVKSERYQQTCFLLVSVDDSISFMIRSLSQLALALLRMRGAQVQRNFAQTAYLRKGNELWQEVLC